MEQNLTRQADEAPGLSFSTARRIFLIRHGVTEWNRFFRYQGAVDIPLSEEGRRQASLTARRFRGVRLDAVVSSPLSRALETARMICETADAPDVEILESLREVNFGDWEGLTVREIVARFGMEKFDAWRQSQISEAATNGEEPESVLARVDEAAEHLCRMPGESIAVVGHGAIFRALLLRLLDLPVSNIFWRMRMDNCSVTLINVDKHGRRSIGYFNDTMHLQVPEDFVETLPL